jgi:hypothetical protein
VIRNPEVVRECREDGKGWRIDHKGDWVPCDPEKFAQRHGISLPEDSD